MWDDSTGLGELSEISIEGAAEHARWICYGVRTACFRGSFLKSVRLDENLRGQGAQVHWELVLALRARQQAKRLFYDPEIEVIHHVAPRLDADQIHRGRFSYEATVDLAFNETFVILKYVSGLFRLTA